MKNRLNASLDVVYVYPLIAVTLSLTNIDFLLFAVTYFTNTSHRINLFVSLLSTGPCVAKN